MQGLVLVDESLHAKAGGFLRRLPDLLEDGLQILDVLPGFRVPVRQFFE